MGREYRLSRDPRLRQESDRRNARVSAAIRVSVRGFELDPHAVVAGVDVGEDFLDIATLAPESHHLSLTRVNLRDIGSAPAGNSLDTNAIALLGARLADDVPELRGAIVLVDSPRWPSDLDWSKTISGDRYGWRSESRPSAVGQSPEQCRMETSLRGAHKTGVVAIIHSQRSRGIDVGLRALVRMLRKLDANSPLTTSSMFPTPPMRYFGAHLNTATCKPHLRMLGQELFGQALNHDYGAASGGIFTRFMIAGFAAYRALEAIGAEVYEGYPDLQFRLWRRRHRLFSKQKGRTSALASRIRVLSALARRLDVSGSRQVQRLDEADAAILALSILAARQYGAIFILENPYEGRFMVALDEPEALRFQQHSACRSVRSILS
jgi:hypothetical protein